MKPVCWWCCYPFDWESIHFPYALKSNVFLTTGHFCSWGCMKAYAIDKGKMDACELIMLMRKRVEGKMTPVQKAPSKYCLEMFGGDVSIEQFRNGIPVHVHIPGEAFQIVKSNKEEKFEIIKLKREKPLEREKNKLESSLGVIRKCSVAHKERKGK